MLAGRPRVLEAFATFSAWTRLAVIGAALISLGSLAGGLEGCYRPNITDGGYVCASTPPVCPDGFTCGADNHCFVHPAAVTPPVDSGMETMMTMMPDAGSDGSMCVPKPLCADQPATGDVCSPSCQTGCGCDRCNVVNGKPACRSVGKAKLGELCTPGTIDNCAPGLFCRTEMCGNGLARCYRHCTTNDQCDGSACTLAITDTSGATSYLTCDVPSSGCDPVANIGCPDPALNCYLTSANQRLCDCPGPIQGQNGAPCLIYSDCAPGYVCVGSASGDGGEVTRCRFVCSVAHPSCTVSAPSCIPSGTGAQFGYCSPP